MNDEVVHTGYYKSALPLCIAVGNINAKEHLSGTGSDDDKRFQPDNATL